MTPKDVTLWAKTSSRKAKATEMMRVYTEPLSDRSDLWRPWGLSDRRMVLKARSDGWSMRIARMVNKGRLWR